ncbi:hypothetical protein QWY20_07775 [Alkalimonas sp. MEB108]|uniref:Uncharacterized protein n=1 Tax=Alkalimonas cellulosilytica TaxID=3058395 RepID=A0ABU7J4C1_9GAMM|nr:hypothetical protein [Alkalimonas sp. MEB108]MEE2001348.1 hypothetical protein [Alkalimonas sp. MEB108]
MQFVKNHGFNEARFLVILCFKSLLLTRWRFKKMNRVSSTLRKNSHMQKINQDVQKLAAQQKAAELESLYQQDKLAELNE